MWSITALTSWTRACSIRDPHRGTYLQWLCMYVYRFVICNTSVKRAFVSIGLSFTKPGTSYIWKIKRPYFLRSNLNFELYFATFSTLFTDLTRLSLILSVNHFWNMTETSAKLLLLSGCLAQFAKVYVYKSLMINDKD